MSRLIEVDVPVSIKKNRTPSEGRGIRHDSFSNRGERVESDSRGENKNIHQRDLHVSTKSLENEK